LLIIIILFVAKRIEMQNNNNRATQQREQRAERARARDRARVEREIEAARVERDQEIEREREFRERQREYVERERRALENLQLQEDPNQNEIIPTQRPRSRREVIPISDEGRRRREVIPMSDEVRTLFNISRALTLAIIDRLAQHASPTEIRPLERELLNNYILIRDRIDPRDTVSREIIARYINQLEESLNQVQVVPAPDPVPAIGSASYPGNQCNICLEPVVGEGCRVNCPAGHIFHCDCMNKWLERSYDLGVEEIKCPFCRQEISSMYHVDIPEGFTTEFGKRIKRRSTKRSTNSGISLKSINSLIKLVQKI